MGIDFVLRSVYSCSFRDYRGYGDFGDKVADGEVFNRYMEIPLTGDTFTVPVMAVRTLMAAWREHCGKGIAMLDCINVFLSHVSDRTNRRTINPIMESVLNNRYLCGHLISISPRGQNFQYYGSAGAIFDKDLNPMAMMAWVFRKRKVLIEEKEKEQLEIVRPELWVNPSAYSTREDMIQKFIAGKMINTYVVYPVCTPDGFYGNMFAPVISPAPVRIVIDYWPYKVQTVCPPSISTTDEELIQLALDHKEELLL